MSAAYRITHLDETRREPPWKALRHRVGTDALGVDAMVADHVGEPVLDGRGHGELYVVLRGAARFTIDDDDLWAPAGTLVVVSDPDAARDAVALEEGTTILAVGPVRAEAFTLSGWERRWLTGADG